MEQLANNRNSRLRLDRVWSVLADTAASFRGLTFYERFEHAVILVLTALIVLIVASATWHLAEVVGWLILADAVQPTNQAVFQTVFGMVFTVIIALEFKHSLLIVLARQESVVRVRSIILIAMLAMIRKFIILDLGVAGENELFGLSAAILSLGVVYWLVRDQDQRLGLAPSRTSKPEPARYE
jgi:uncharacterized membrane protein (DUF373 family)